MYKPGDCIFSLTSLSSFLHFAETQSFDLLARWQFFLSSLDLPRNRWLAACLMINDYMTHPSSIMAMWAQETNGSRHCLPFFFDITLVLLCPETLKHIFTWAGEVNCSYFKRTIFFLRKHWFWYFFTYESLQMHFKLILFVKILFSYSVDMCYMD